MSARATTERRAVERIVRGAFRQLTGRRAGPVHYAIMDDTPVGVLGLAATDAGLSHVDFIRDEDRFVEKLLRDFGERPVIRSAALDKARRELQRYFDGRDLSFDLEVDLSRLSAFDRKVLLATARIPAGKVATYTQVAAKAGNPRASRAAGNALHKNPVAIIVPCHRVLRTDGSLGGYGGGLPAKEWLLRHEGAIGGSLL
jgi:methylated-DNA-[protein]-cysteine S-methyltransferase